MTLHAPVPKMPNVTLDAPSEECVSEMPLSTTLSPPWVVRVHVCRACVVSAESGPHTMGAPTFGGPKLGAPRGPQAHFSRGAPLGPPKVGAPLGPPR
jgi:hypothetical protein